MIVRDCDTLSTLASKLNYTHLDNILKGYEYTDFTPIQVEVEGVSYSIMARYSKPTKNIILISCADITEKNNKYYCINNYNISFSPKFVLVKTEK